MNNLLHFLLPFHVTVTFGPPLIYATPLPRAYHVIYDPYLPETLVFLLILFLAIFQAVQDLEFLGFRREDGMCRYQDP